MSLFIRHFWTVSFGILAGLIVLHSSVTNAADIDENGIDDGIDQHLINTYSPYLYYASGEDYWPVTVSWFVQHSFLNYGDMHVFTPSDLTANPLLILNPGSSSACPPGSECATTPSSVALGGFNDADYHLDLDDALQHGEGPFPIGTYAHVIQLNDETITQILSKNNYPPLPNVQRGDLLIQYWQFFAFNNARQDLHIGNHEGDIEYLEVYVNRSALTNATSGSLKYIVYHHHGDGDCPPTVIPGDHYFPPARAIQHFDLPPDGIPKCYLEDGDHEWWPWASGGGECTFSFLTVDNNGHDGLSAVNYRTTDILNLGQSFAPMPGNEPLLILFFNGTWGTYGNQNDPPNGPPLQFYPASPLFVGYVDPVAPILPSTKGWGSRYFPLKTIMDAKFLIENTMNQVPPFGAAGRILMKPGNYKGMYTFSKPMTLEGWGSGVVTIGQ